ncbi:hypothetical protein [Sphingosinicella sp. YJ22]|uniref:hypothetical protein n=1 Tax=Sphingosinicella sp. YJ22 TaxID=1104780 RepID=UPI00140AD4BF|nr:hypothetical protein [Sphingosinicella sp. YJ22]
MKIANVVSVQDRDDLAAPAPTGPASKRLGRMADLLRAFPAISDEERRQLLDFLTKGMPEEIAQVTHMQGMERSFAAFRKAHPSDFPQGWRSWLPMIVFGAIIVIAVAWRLSGITL